ncbi:hypothetical protein RIX58_004098 [Salmonella enterica]|nr:hypothetical protein [Salmonella enterica]
MGKVSATAALSGLVKQTADKAEDTPREERQFMPRQLKLFGMKVTVQQYGCHNARDGHSQQQAVTPQPELRLFLLHLQMQVQPHPRTG